MYALMGVRMRTFWQHTSGRVYAVQSDTFGHITGAAGPLDACRLLALDDYRYEPGPTAWIARAIARHDLRLFDPKAQTAGNHTARNS
jgi:hypothetical protein